MKKVIILTTVFITSIVGTFAQVNKDKEENKKLGEYDEIIIKRKDGDKDAKVVLEIRDDEVFIDGKPLKEYVDNIVSVNLRSPRHFSLDGSGVTAFRRGDRITDDNRPFLGVATEGSTAGAKITNVSNNSAAEKAGLKVGDIITKINDEPVFDHEQVIAIISKLKPDDKVNIVYKRDKKEHKATVILGKRPSPQPDVQGIPGVPFYPDGNFFRDRDLNFDNDELGKIFKFRTSKPRLGIKAQDTEDGKGVKVLEVEPGSAAETSGIKANDLITHFDGKEVNSAEELARVSREAKDKYNLDVQLKRDGKTKNITVKVPKKLNTAEL